MCNHFTPPTIQRIVKVKRGFPRVKDVKLNLKSEIKD